jgi:RNA recognition motif-containing protein
MDWPAGSINVPPYLTKGLSFDDMLVAYRRYAREMAKDHIDEEGDAKMGSDRKGKSIQINKNGKLGSIAKDVKKKGSVYDSKRSTSGITVVVKNIPFTINEGSLRNHFIQIGKIAQVRIYRDDNKKSLGSGAVTFQSRKDANTAMDTMQNTRLGDRNIRVTLAE